MAMNKYKRDYNFKSDMGDNNGFIWLIVIAGVAVIAVAYFF